MRFSITVTHHEGCDRHLHCVCFPAIPLGVSVTAVSPLVTRLCTDENCRPVSSGPLPVIPIEGRDFGSRFAPEARPVFPRSYYENITAREAEPGPTAVKRSYPAGPTASGLVFRSEHMN